MFNFQIAGRESELVLKSFNTINKQTLSSFLFSWDDIKPVREKVSKKNVTEIAVLNDEAKPIKGEYLEALNAKKVNYIIWGDRFSEDSTNKLKPA